MKLSNHLRRLGIVLAVCTLALLTQSGAAHAQGVLFVANDNVGIGVDNPLYLLHLRATDGSAQFRVVENIGSVATRQMFTLQNNGGAGFALYNANSNQTWQFDSGGGTLNINALETVGTELSIDTAGNATFRGSVSTTDCSPCMSDYVFESEYDLMPLSDLEEFVWANQHLPNVPSQKDVDEAGKLNLTQMQVRLLEKIEELTLYTIEQQKQIDKLAESNAEQAKLIREMRPEGS